MVFFSCESCGASLKKNQVQKHLYQCRNASHFSCIDCSTVFDAESYAKHTKCITEEQKYSDKNFVPKEAKGEVKQQAWVDQVNEAIASANPRNNHLQVLLQRLLDYPNIPRKAQKFKNFLRNSLAVRETRLIDEAWEAISGAVAKPQTTSNGNAAAAGRPKESDGAEVNGTSAEAQPANGKKRHIAEEMNGVAHESTSEEKVAKKKTKVAKDSPTEHEDATNKRSALDDSSLRSPSENCPAKFNWRSTFADILGAKPDKPMKLDRLRKKVWQAMQESGYADRYSSPEEMYPVFEKKVRAKAGSKYEITGNKVQLTQSAD